MLKKIGILRSKFVDIGSHVYVCLNFISSDPFLLSLKSNVSILLEAIPFSSHFKIKCLNFISSGPFFLPLKSNVSILLEAIPFSSHQNQVSQYYK